MAKVHDSAGIVEKLARLLLLFSVTIICGCVSVDKAIADVDRICVESSTVELLGESEWVVIGNLFGGLGTIDSQDAGDAFAAYSDCSNERSSFQTIDEFSQAIAGWTFVEVSRGDVILFSYHGNIPVFVPHDLLDRDDFDVGLPGFWMGYGTEK